ALFRAGGRPRRSESLHAQGSRHPVQPIARQRDDNVQPPRHHVTPLRQPGGESAAGHQRRTDPAVGGGGGFGANPEGDAEGGGVEILFQGPARKRRLVVPSLTRRTLKFSLSASARGILLPAASSALPADPSAAAVAAVIAPPAHRQSA